MRLLLLSICIYLTFPGAWQLPMARYIFSFTTLILKRGQGKKKYFARSTSSVLEIGFGVACDSARLESDPNKPLLQILDQLIALGQTTQQLHHAHGGNHRPEKISEVIQQLTEGGDHAYLPSSFG
ncbi:hypothetical protein ACFLVW_07285 [Chloroflexota bacterium]